MDFGGICLLAWLKKNKRTVLTVSLVLFGNFMIFLTLWLSRQYEKVYLDQILYQLKTSAAGVHRALAGGAVLRVGGYFLLASLVELLLYKLLSGKAGGRVKNWSIYAKYCGSRACAFFQRIPLALATLLTLAGIGFFMIRMDVITYAERQVNESDFIQTHYADPATTTVTFPEKKRNLVYIFLESMEATYSDTRAGEPIPTDFIPNLSRLARENVSFSNTEGPGGALSFAGTTWTASAMVAQTSGVPSKVPLTADAYGLDAPYMPGLVSIGEILRDQGYAQTILMGSDADFHGRKPYFQLHGDYEILDINALKDQGRLDPDYRIWWGFEDEKLFAYAKEEVTRLAAGDQPFNFTLLTADTHFPNGLPCNLCQDEHDTQYANVLSCSDRQVYEFVTWLQAQPFYENTTIVICGDHLTMDAHFLEDIDPNYTRTVYNCFINAPVSPIRTKNRQFGTFDLFPTTLAALGARIEGDRLALGTDLFSPSQTLAEEYGFETLDEELQHGSEYYNTKILGMEE